MIEVMMFINFILLFATYIVSKGSASVKILRDAGLLDEEKDIKRLKILYIKSAFFSILPAIFGVAVFKDINYPDTCVTGSLFLLFSAAILYGVPLIEEDRLRMLNFGEKKEAEVVDFKNLRYTNLIEYLPENNINTHKTSIGNNWFGGSFGIFTFVQYEIGDKITVFTHPKNENKSIIYTPKLWDHYYIRK